MTKLEAWRRGATVALALFALLPTAAQAQERPPRPDDVSALSVYTEVMPTSAGPRAVPRPGAPAARVEATAAPLPLSTEVLQELRQTPREEAKKLEQIATSRAHGAPPARQEEAPDSRLELPRDDALALSTTLDVASRSGRVIGLLGALAAATALIVFVRRRPV